MSTIDLIILGSLLEGPKSAYEMKRELETQNITKWVKISTPAIYKNILKLNKNGLLHSKTVREGEMPEKTVYTINENGRRHFNKLMEKYSSDVGKIFFDFSAFIANLDKLEKSEGIRMLGNLNREFKKTENVLNHKAIEKSNLPYNAHSIILLYRDLNTIFVKWSEKLIEDFENDKTD